MDDDEDYVPSDEQGDDDIDEDALDDDDMEEDADDETKLLTAGVRQGQDTGNELLQNS